MVDFKLEFVLCEPGNVRFRYGDYKTLAVVGLMSNSYPWSPLDTIPVRKFGADLIARHKASLPLAVVHSDLGKLIDIESNLRENLLDRLLVPTTWIALLHILLL